MVSGSCLLSFLNQKWMIDEDMHGDMIWICFAASKDGCFKSA